MSTNFFFSKILHKNILSNPGSVIGKLYDVVLDFSSSKAVIVALEVKSGNRKTYFSADFFEVYNDGKENFSIKLNTDELKVLPNPENGFFLGRNFLDKQIVDINGKKVERVNDVRMGYVQGKWTILAVDIGLRGLLRRLGLEYPAIKISSIMNKNFRNTLVLWDNVQTLSSAIPDLQLSTSMGKLKTMHAADIADIIEELDSNNQRTLFNHLDEKQAAEVLEEMEAESQISIINTLPDEKASDLLEIMPSDEAADILEEMEDARVEVLLEQMNMENQTEIRELMEYEEKTVGSVMAKDFVSFLPDITVEAALTKLREDKPNDEVAHYIYLTNRRQKLIGVVTLLDLASADHTYKLYDLMDRNLKSVHDEERIEKVMEIMQKYNLLALPVVDEDNELVGITSLNDLVHEYIRLRRVTA